MLPSDKHEGMVTKFLFYLDTAPVCMSIDYNFHSSLLDLKCDVRFVAFLEHSPTL